MRHSRSQRPLTRYADKAGLPVVAFQLSPEWKKKNVRRALSPDSVLITFSPTSSRRRVDDPA